MTDLDLSGFSGGGDQYKHPLFGFVYTEGIAYGNSRRTNPNPRRAVWSSREVKHD